MKDKLKAEIAEVIAKVNAQVETLKTLDPTLVDELTTYDIQKAYSQFAANIERATTDAQRRREFGQIQ